MYWENLRNFETLELPSKDKKFSDKTSLVQIQNGYGKTTTLYLLRAIFTNTPIDQKYLKAGYKYRYPHKEWGGDQNEPSKFFVELDIDGEFCRLGLEINHKTMEQRFTTFREKLGGTKPIWNPPHIFRRLFQGKPDFTNLFILDGELAKDLNRAAKSSVVKNSIRQVTNLSGLYSMIGSSEESGQINRLKRERLSTLIGDKEGRGKVLNSVLQTVRDRINEQKERSNEIIEYIDEIDTSLVAMNTEKESMEEDMSKDKEEYDRAKEAFEESKNDLVKISESVLSKLFQPAFIHPEWVKIQDFHSSQVKAKLPRSVGRTWFNELMNLEKCICGRNWDEHSIKHINDHLEDYLDDKLMTYVKEMQDSVAEHKSSMSLGRELTRIKEKQISKAQKLQILEDLRAEATEEERINFQKLVKDIGALENTREDFVKLKEEILSEKLEYIKENKLDVDVYNRNDTITRESSKINRVINLKCLRIIESSILDELAAIGGAENIAKGADMIQEIISDVLSKIEEEIKIELERRMNDSISKMVGAGLDGGLTVRVTENGLQYFNPSGDRQSGVNMAAELGGSYAFISALYEYAEVSIPLVLDTPLAGFGQGMSASWTQLVPTTFDQVIALINSNEMISIKGWFETNEIDCYLIRRTNEEISKGKPQTGKMIVDDDIINFVNYESDVLKSEAL